jgi:SAM-dependent methyltransferase
MAPIMAPMPEAEPESTPYEYRGLKAQAWDLLRGDYSSWPDRPFYLAAIRQFGEPALDVGCGTGRLLLDYLAQGVDCDGVDNSPEMLALCRQKAAQLGLPLPQPSAARRGADHAVHGAHIDDAISLIRLNPDVDGELKFPFNAGLPTPAAMYYDGWIWLIYRFLNNWTVSILQHRNRRRSAAPHQMTAWYRYRAGSDKLPAALVIEGASPWPRSMARR